jgi:glucose/arabinose dehydrogenase/mono/diheme cytochrome c family protein
VGHPRALAAALAVASLVGATTACTGDDAGAPATTTGAAPATSSTLPADAPCRSVGGLGARAGGAPPASPGPAPATTTAPAAADEPVRVLAFTRTVGFHHDSIGAASRWLATLDRSGVDATVTDDPSAFTARGLARYDVVAFVNTTGDVLDEAQQAALRTWVEAGGGFVGIHAAADTEHDWPWYGELVGASFTTHPPGIQRATVTVEAPDDPTVAGFAPTFTVHDELYNFDRNPRRTSDVLLTMDEAGATGFDGKPVGDGFTQGDDHPMAWSHQVGLGRSWYTALGHSAATWSDPAFRAHVVAGIRWAAAPGRWRIDTIATDLVAASLLDVAPSGMVLWAERTGEVVRWDPATGEEAAVGTVPTRVEGEGGLIGMRLAPDADRTGHLFTYATVPGAPGAAGTNVVARYNLDARCRLVASSRVEVLRVPNEYSGHQAGDLAFLPDGTLLVATGDNTYNQDDGFAPLDDRPGQERNDARRTASNPDDLRGKVLRIRPDGTIPPGNLFPGGRGGRAEVWAMGLRNPYRLAVDPTTGRVWFADIGPDAPAPSDRGPQGFDELDTATAPGDFGWPRCIADRLPYRRWDPDTGAIGAPLDCADTRTPVLAYDYTSTAIPALGSSTASSRYGTGPDLLYGRALMAGPLYDPPPGAPLALPLGRSLLLHEYGRSLLLAGTPGPDGTLTHLRRVAPWFELNSPIDVAAAPDGSLYVLETGQWSGGSRPGHPRLLRLSYSATGAPPAPPATRRVDEPAPTPGGADGAGGGNGDDQGGGDGEGAADGETVYRVHCSACHGDDGAGGTGPSLIDVADRLTVAQHLAVVRDGRKAMPAWGDVLTDEEIRAVVAFERTLRTGR